MQHVLDVDWRGMFVPKVGLLELFLRGTLMYLGILVVLRLLRRQKGSLNTADLLVLIVVADAAQNAMSADYNSVTEGAVLVGTIFGWDFVLDTLSFKYPWVHRLLNAEPLALVLNGQVQRKNLRSEMLTVGDLMEQLREQGISDVSKVRKCCLESDGHLSVLKVEEGADDRPPQHTPLT